METLHGKPMYTKVVKVSSILYFENLLMIYTQLTNRFLFPFPKVITEGRLILEFTFDDLMRIKSWHFAVRAHRELIPRSVVAMHTQQPDPSMLEQLTKNITRQGITNSTLNYLRVSGDVLSTFMSAVAASI